MRAMQDYKFDKLKKLAIEGIEELNDQNLKECNRFMKYCFPNSLKVFYMQSDMTPIKNLKSGLEVLLRSVHHQVYLMCFSFDQDTLKSVIESSRSAKEVVLY